MNKDKLNVVREAALTGAQLHGRILITGGAGFIGRAIVRTAILDGWDCSFTIVSRDEQKQAHMKKRVAEWALNVDFPLTRSRLHDVSYTICDINDTNRLADIMCGHNLVVHAAALKYIPEAEREVAECINVNLQGSMSVVSAARAAEVERVIGLSTDKATSPLNVYGATKFLMERLYAEMDIVCANIRAAFPERQEPRFTTVRYGNVIGSTGSVIPNFLDSLARHNKVFITDPTMTRFWITYREAIDLICEAAVCSEVGVTVVPRPKAMRLGDLAEACIEIECENRVAEKNQHEKADEWLDRDGPIDLSDAIEVIGLRPGEKMDEDLLNEAESLRTIDTGPYYYLMPPGYNNGDAPFYLSSESVERIDTLAMKAAIREAVQV